MSIIAQTSVGGSTYSLASTAYCTCATAAATAAKVAYVQGNSTATFALITGITIHVKFTNANSASSPTLNVNGTGAKAIKRYGTTAAGTSSSNSWAAGSVVSLTYDGSYWVMNYDSNSTYSNASLGQGYATQSNNTTTATTAITAALSSYSLGTGGIVAVKFDDFAVPANATLNVNSKGAKNIYYNGSAITAGVIGKGDIGVFIYDGTQYHLIGCDSFATKSYVDSAISNSIISVLNADLTLGS